LIARLQSFTPHLLNEQPTRTRSPLSCTQNQSDSQSVNRSALISTRTGLKEAGRINQPTNQPTNQSTNQAEINQSIHLHLDWSRDKPARPFHQRCISAWIGAAPTGCSKAASGLRSPSIIICSSSQHGQRHMSGLQQCTQDTWQQQVLQPM